VNSGRSVRIYIAEDSRLLLGTLRLHIKEAGGLELVGHSPTCKRAAEEILTLSPDLVLLDVHLADGDGFEILEQLDGTGRSPVVAMMTLEASEALRNRAEELGVDLFFDKASEAGALLDLLHNLGKGSVTLESLRRPGASAHS